MVLAAKRNASHTGASAAPRSGPTHAGESHAASRIGLLLGSVLLIAAGCQCINEHSIPAKRLPADWTPECRNSQTTIDLRLLSQTPPPQHVIGPKDVLGVFVQGVYSTEDQTLPPFAFPGGTGQTALEQPAIGNPVTVREDGTISLPLVKSLHVAGMTLPEVAVRLREVYTKEQKVLRSEAAEVTVNLIRPRTVRVMVVRSDVATPLPVAETRQNFVQFKHGSGTLVELPAYENDVMHALVATGGMPGIEARDEVIVLKNNSHKPNDFAASAVELQNRLQQQTGSDAHDTRLMRIPLRLQNCEDFPFTPNDMILNTGDIVYIEPRTKEFYYIGGLLDGGQIPLPRDYDLDVLGAIAIANGSVAGPVAGASSGTLYRGTVGQIIPPTRVIIVRTLPTGGQIKIDVDIRAALDDPRERVIIQQGDLVLLKYRPLELLGNIALNIINLSYTVTHNG